MTKSPQLLHGDCLELMKQIPDGSVDLVLCDLPYGTTLCKWDSMIPFEPLWEQYSRICRGAVVLTAVQPFTSALIMSNVREFKYSWVWRKTKHGGVFNAKNRPLKVHEDVLVFSKLAAANVNGVRMTYNPQGVTDCRWGLKNNSRKKDSTVGGRPSRVGGYIQTQTGYPVDIIECGSEARHLHPTQKPVALMEYLIRTYTNEGDTVMDNCMGSGTTGVACVNTGRNFIGIEKDELYFGIAKRRILDAMKPVEPAHQPELF